MPMASYWERAEGSTLRQGDYLPDCYLPVFGPDITPGKTEQIPVGLSNLIILTQSCDLENKNLTHVALSPIYSVEEFTKENPQYKADKLNLIRAGRIEGLHLLASQTEPEKPRKALIVDFRQVYSLPYEYLTTRAAAIGSRWRLCSPFLEHFSQAFARFYMRVGLPSQIPKFTSE
ncbi:MAG: hypothetical protein HY694_03430 [Deltaproteobacteria bacterium]|nr:hypothetical protein [Deltaproteobacteria bacterium]